MHGTLRLARRVRLKEAQKKMTASGTSFCHRLSCCSCEVGTARLAGCARTRCKTTMSVYHISLCDAS